MIQLDFIDGLVAKGHQELNYEYLRRGGNWKPKKFVRGVRTFEKDFERVSRHSFSDVFECLKQESVL
ncbi:hypothetical protein F2P79_004800 [Pimephales promelas]|nr:hypothetical protein F2P79_004800 [Pimephales promelas]KAG1962727.1 hypothetical protein F2P79_004800 [Pimephales promelas]